MMLRALLAACCVFLGACSSEPDYPPGNPALWEVTGADGQHGYLFGTVHALPDGVTWRTELFNEAFGNSRLLVVEALPANNSEQQDFFRRLSTTPGLPTPLERVAPEQREQLTETFDQVGLSDGDLRNTESWAVALAVSSAAQVGETGNGVERVLLADAESKRIAELEGYEPQLRIFDELPEQDQLDLLGYAAVDVEASRQAGRSMIEKWLLGDIESFEAEFETGMLADEGLYEALLARRNHAWIEMIIAWLDGIDTPLVAVGAAHMIGPDGLPQLLRARGYTVTRIQ